MLFEEPIMLGDILIHTETDEGEIFANFWCEGCHVYHRLQLNVAFKPSWSFNGNNKKPTFEPALKIKNAETKEVMCHLTIKDGKIKYYSDCKHELAGFMVNMVAA
jgi:hypothetical protein